MPKRESDICRRLRDYRQKSGLSLRAFAKEAGLPEVVLATYEHARVRLNYRSAWRILKVFPMNPEWLATGSGLVMPGFAIPSPEDIGASPRKLFSEVFDEGLIPRVVPAMLATKPNPPLVRAASIKVSVDALGRLNAREILSNYLRAWFERVPDEKLNEFLNAIYHRAMDVLESCPLESDEVVLRRINDMALAEVRNAAVMRGIPSPRESVKVVSQALPDAAATKIPGEKLSWERLREQVIRLTRDWGGQAGLARDLRVSRQAVGQWLAGNTVPSSDTMLRLMEWVGKRKSR